MFRRCMRWVAALLGAGAVACPAATNRLDLATAINRALQRNRDLARSALTVQSRQLGIQSADADFAFTWGPAGDAGLSPSSGSWSSGLDVSKLWHTGTRIDARASVQETDLSEAASYQRSSVRVELDQPLLRQFGRLVNEESLVRASHQVKAARRALARQKEDLILSVVRTYETLIRLQKEIQSDEALCARMDKTYELTRLREEQGRGTRVDTLRVELQRGDAQARLASGREQLFSGSRDFAELLGDPPDAEWQLEPPPLLTMELPAADAAMKLALQSRLDYAQALEDCSDAERGVRIARRNLLPDLSLVASYERYGEGKRLSESAGLENENWFAGLSMRGDLRRLHEKVALQQTELTADDLKAVVQITRIAIAKEVQQRLSAYRQAQTDLDISQRNFGLAANRSRLAHRLFEMGRGDSFAVTDAEDQRVQAEIRLLEARATASVAGYELKRTLGTLIAYDADLKPAASM